jgi:hypothetical protein
MAMTDATLSAALPAVLRPFQCRLNHLGRDRDGGYLVCLDDIMASEALVSMGVNTDWSFEADVARRKPVLIHAYDGSVGQAKLWKMFAKSLIRPFPPSLVVDSFLAALRFPAFFGHKATHFEEYVGSETLAPSVGLDIVLSRLPAKQAQAIFFKIDIEGSEYKLFDDLVAVADRTTGLAIELHDCDQNLDLICSFVKAYSLRLIHTHANNYAGLGAGGIPKVLELTFTSSHAGNEFGSLPHPLEQRNSRSRPAIGLTFAT